MAPPDIRTLIGFNLKTAWSRHFLPASPEFFDAKKFGFVPAQLWQGGADVCDALRVGFSVEDLKGGGWSARSVAEAVGGEFSSRNGIFLNNFHNRICLCILTQISRPQVLPCAQPDGPFATFWSWAPHLRAKQVARRTLLIDPH
jgi:hypothetical protein